MVRFIKGYLVIVLSGFPLMTYAQLIFNRPGMPAMDSSRAHFFSSPVSKINTLLKVGLTLPLLRQSSFTGYYASLGLEALVEQKIMGGLAVLGGLETSFGLSLNGYRARYVSLEMPVALRYYFSLTRREKQRPDRHSFFSHYVAVQSYNLLYSNLIYPPVGTLSDLQRYQRRNLIGTITNSGSVGDQFLWLDYVLVQLGTQQRILRQYYLDANILVPLSVLAYNRGEYALASPALLSLKFGRTSLTNNKKRIY